MKIIQRGDTVLREKARKLDLDEIQSPRIKKLIKKMSHTLSKEKNGVALAAPQVGKSIQLFIVSGELFSREDYHHPDLIFINPRIINFSEEKVTVPEGCLSVAGYHGKIERHKEVEMEFQDQDGEVKTIKTEGLLAQIFQHETDHLKGVLYTDTALEIEELKD